MIPKSKSRLLKAPKSRPLSAPSSADAKGHFKLTLEYDGSRYRGWQEQSNASTVQEVLKKAMDELFPAGYQMAGAGRTDAGVHALAQVVSLHTPVAVSSGDLLDGLNRRLHKDVNVLKVEPASPKFHARHSAVMRYYVYQISLRRTAFGKAYCWWVRSPLDLGAMERSLPPFVGLHDYRAFSDRRIGEEDSTRVKVEDLRLYRRGDVILIRIRAAHFLWRMVRRVVGVLVQIGLDEIPPELSISELGGRYPKLIPEWTAPAAGLFLEHVLYPGDLLPGDPVPLIALGSFSEG